MGKNRCCQETFLGCWIRRRQIEGRYGGSKGQHRWLETYYLGECQDEVFHFSLKSSQADLLRHTLRFSLSQSLKTNPGMAYFWNDLTASEGDTFWRLLNESFEKKYGPDGKCEMKQGVVLSWGWKWSRARSCSPSIFIFKCWTFPVMQRFSL